MSVYVLTKLCVHSFIPLLNIEASPERHVLHGFCLVEHKKQKIMKVEGEFLGKRKEMKRRGKRGDGKSTSQAKESMFYACLNREWSKPLFFTI